MSSPIGGLRRGEASVGEELLGNVEDALTGIACRVRGGLHGGSRIEAIRHERTFVYPSGSRAVKLNLSWDGLFHRGDRLGASFLLADGRCLGATHQVLYQIVSVLYGNLL